MRSFDTHTTLSMADAEAAVRESLAAQGFGVLTEIDLAGTLRAKLGVERPAMKLLGACNPGFANRALDIDPTVSRLLPCNVVLADTGGGTTVSAIDPREMMNDPAFAELAGDVAEKLAAAIDAVPAR